MSCGSHWDDRPGDDVESAFRGAQPGALGDEGVGGGSSTTRSLPKPPRRRGDLHQTAGVDGSRESRSELFGTESRAEAPWSDRAMFRAWWRTTAVGRGGPLQAEKRPLGVPLGAGHVCQ